MPRSVDKAAAADPVSMSLSINTVYRIFHCLPTEDLLNIRRTMAGSKAKGNPLFRRPDLVD